MSMTKKDYYLVAGVLLATKPNKAWLNKYQQWYKIVETMSLELMNTNPRFDRTKFLTACGIQD